MAYAAIKVPVLPKPALQCTATTFSLSAIYRNLSILSSPGTEPSRK